MTDRVADVAIHINGLTWREMVSQDPRLARLETVASEFRNADDGICHVDRWYGYLDTTRSRKVVGLKHRMLRVAGWVRDSAGTFDLVEERPLSPEEWEPQIIDAGQLLDIPSPKREPHPLRSQKAYDRAYQYLFTRMLPCRACGLGISDREWEIEQLLIDRLEAFGTKVQRQVPVAGGRADVVTEDAVYEVKRSITRSGLYHAIGQVSLYAAALNRPRRVVVGLKSGENVTDLIAHAALAGIEVETW